MPDHEPNTMKHVHMAPEPEKAAHLNMVDPERHDSLHSTVHSEKGSVSHGAEGEAFSKERARAERRLLLKMDFGILPFAILLYLSAYLDRGNM